MISTGTDIKPLECLLFMRDVKSRVYFEQMKGRGTRVISTTDLKSVTPDVEHKTHFVIVDAVGLRDESLEDSESLPAPEILAQEIVENLGVALEQFESIVEELENPSNPK